MEWHEMATRSR